MSRFTAMLAQAPETRSRSGVVDRWVDSLEDDDRKEFLKAVNDPSIPTVTIVTGHYHNSRYLTSHGRHIVECPTLESSSNWLYKTAGEWSQPGVTVFNVGVHGLHGLRFIDYMPEHKEKP